MDAKSLQVYELMLDEDLASTEKIEYYKWKDE